MDWIAKEQTDSPCLSPDSRSDILFRQVDSLFRSAELPESVDTASGSLPVLEISDTPVSPDYRSIQLEDDDRTAGGRSPDRTEGRFEQEEEPVELEEKDSPFSDGSPADRCKDKECHEKIGPPADQTTLSESIVDAQASDAVIRAVGEQLDSLSPELQQILIESGVRIVVAGDLSDYDPELADRHPRGWPPGSTLEMCGGLFLPGRNDIVINESVRQTDGTMRHRSIDQIANTVSHEIGHALDLSLGCFSDSLEFREAYEQDLSNLSQEDLQSLGYFTQPGDAGREELFAEMISELLGDTDGHEVSGCFPLVQELVEQLWETFHD